MCEETDREGRGLENKWIYVLLLFAILAGQSKRAFLFKIIYFISRFKKKKPGLFLLCKLIAASPPERGTWILLAKQRAAGFFHVNLMFLIKCEELIRNGPGARCQAGHRVLHDL